MRFQASLIVAALLLIAADEPKGQPDPQARAEPRSGPGAGQKYLEKFVGEWDVAKAFFPQSGEPRRAKGQCRQSMIHDGRFLQSDFVFGEGETRSTGLGIIGFETATGLFTSIWTDSRRTAMSLRQSRDPFDGEQIVLYSRSLAAEGKEARVTRTVSRVEDQARKIVHRQYAVNPGGEDRLMMELIMTRKPAAATPDKGGGDE